jgi:uncharacterized delta-60 repeat protein
MQWFKSIVSRARACSFACGKRALKRASALLCAAFILSALPTLAQIPGSFDTTFALGNGKIPNLAIGNGNDRAFAVALQPDGKIVMAGDCNNSAYSKMCLARLNADGTLDTTFVGPPGSLPGSGKFILSIGPTNETAYAVAVQPDGKIVVSGSCTANSATNDFCIARLLPNGDYDASFVGPNGNANGRFLLDVGGATDDGYALALQPDSKIVMVGACDNGTNFDFCFVRLNADGRLDASFDGESGNANGKFLLDIGSNSDYVNAIALQPDGKIVVVGICGNGSNNDFCAARLNGGPFGGQNCKFDVDGDGLVTATTDMLIGTRIALGLRGTSVINGISFPANAKRNTWPLIRDYLVSQCGMSVF